MTLGNKETVEKIMYFLTRDIPFTYLRYGDGDFIAMYPSSVGKTIGGNNKSVISVDIQNKLIESYFVDKDNYLVGTLEYITHERSMGKNVNFNTINNLPFTPPSLKYSAIALQEAFMENKEIFLKVCKRLNKKRTLYINHYNEPVLEKFFGEITHYIKVPKFNACNQYKEVTEQIYNTSSDSFDQIIMSCGQLARVIGHDLYKKFPNKTILDVGSVSDKLIFNTETFKGISVRGHIRNNKSHIHHTLNFLLENIE